MASTIQVKVQDELKEKADELFNDLGIDTITAIHMFLKRAVAVNGFPFEVRKTCVKSYSVLKEREYVPSDSEDLGDKWDEIKRKMKAEFDITDVSYKCFIEMLGYRVKDNDFYIMVPTKLNHALNYLSNKYKDYFRVIINEVLDKDYEISFQLEKDNDIRISE